MDKTELISALEKEELLLSEKLHSLRQTIITLRQSVAVGEVYHSSSNGHSKIGNDTLANTPSKYEAFFKAKSWREKVTIIFKTENRFLHYREIINIIISLMPKETKEGLKNSISPALSFLKSEGVIVKVKYGDSNLNSFWGSKNWLDANGKVKPEHMYDKSQITHAGATKDYGI